MAEKLHTWKTLRPDSGLGPSASSELDVVEEGLERATGLEAQIVNIELACSITDRLKAILGPTGMDMIIVRYHGRSSEQFTFKITNKGMTILEATYAERFRPVARLIVNAARAQEKEVGDGTTTAVVLTGELLRQALRLLKLGLHRTIIVQGYELAAKEAARVQDDMAIKVSAKDKYLLRNVAMTALAGSIAEAQARQLANLVLQAVRAVAEKRATKMLIKKDDIRIEKIEGGAIEDTELIQGVILHRGRANPSMPERVDNANVAIATSFHIKAKDTTYYQGDISRFEGRDTPLPLSFRIKDPKQIGELVRAEERIMQEMASKVKRAGANVLIAEKGIDDKVNDALTRGGILALAGVDAHEIQRLAKATGAVPVADITRLTTADLGHAGTVEEVRKGAETMTYVKDCKNPKSVTLLVHGTTPQILNQVAEAAQDCLDAIECSLRNGKVLPGGGAAEIEVANRLRDYAKTIRKREQMVIEAFADAVESVPATLAHNAGMDSVDTIIRLRASHRRSKRARGLGIDVLEGRIVDTYATGILDPLAVKRQAIKSAHEAASLILSIDDVIAEEQRPMPPQHVTATRPRPKGFVHPFDRR